MTEKPKAGATWHSTPVALRSDLYRRALEQGIDISDACNRALASLTGIEYAGRQRGEVPVPPPVIVAKNGSSPYVPGETEKSPSRDLPPVINADDPAAPARVVQAKAQKKIPPAPVPVPAPVKERAVATPASGARKAAAGKRRAAPAKKGSWKDALKLFFSSRVTRSGDEKDRVAKDEFYELFARFCRDHHVTPVPERKTVTVALKNRFALAEKTIDEKQCWTGILLK